MPDIYFDVDTALSEVPVNIFPLTDDTDFKTRETDVAYNATGMDLVWNFVTTSGAMTQTAVTPTTGGAYDWTHQGDGIYSIEIPASGGASINNDTEGFGWFSGVCTGVLPWRGPVLGFRASGINDKLIDDAYSTTRGLSGTALPAAAADAAGGLPISDAGGLDIDVKLAHAEEITTARMGALTDWLDGGRLDLLIDALLTRLTETRAGYLDNLTRLVGTIATGTHNPQSGDSYPVVTHVHYGNDALRGYLLDPVYGLEAIEIVASETKADVGSLPLNLPSVIQIREEMDANSTQLSGIKTKTDQLTFATPNKVDATATVSTAGLATEAKQDITNAHLTDIKGATFSGATDSLEAIRDRGDAAWVTGGGLSGSNTALITVCDGSGNNIVDAYVDIFDSGNTSFQQRFITNSSGQVTFSINDGTWYIRILKSGYTFTAVAFVVSGNYTHTYNMTPYVITPPTSPDLCRVYTYVYKPDGTFHTTLSGIATIGVYTEDNQYYTYQSTAIYSNTTGLIYWDIKQGASAVLTITELEYFSKSILVPDLATSELNDL